MTTSTKEIGDAREDEILARFRVYDQSAEKTPVNAPGIDIIVGRLAAIQVKAYGSISPEDISHFADCSMAYALKIFIADSFTKGSHRRAQQRGVWLRETEEFRRECPLPTEPASINRLFPLEKPHDISVLSDKKFGDGPNKVPTVEMEKSEPRTVRQVQTVTAIQPYSLPVASLPKSRYFRTQKRAS